MSPGLENEHDPDGELTLHVIAAASRFNRWMYETIAPFCTGRILEIGSGIGNISAFFLRDRFRMTLSDLRSGYCEMLKSKFPDPGYPESIIRMDLADPDFENEYKSLLCTFDTVFALNVIEHIEKDSLAIQNCRRLLKSGGRIIILVPAFQALYNKFDENLGHHRRYNLQSLGALLSNNGFRIIHSRYFNLAGIPGWYYSGRILKNNTIPGGQMKIYDMMVPLFRLADKIIFNAAGLSVISVGEIE